MKVTIQGKELKFRYNWGSVYTYESLTEQPINFKNHLSVHLLLYSILLYNNPDDFAMEFKDFVEVLEDLKLERTLEESLIKELKLKGQTIEPEGQEDGEPKKD